MSALTMVDLPDPVEPPDHSEQRRIEIGEARPDVVVDLAHRRCRGLALRGSTLEGQVQSRVGQGRAQALERVERCRAGVSHSPQHAAVRGCGQGGDTYSIRAIF